MTVDLLERLVLFISFKMESRSFFTCFPFTDMIFQPTCTPISEACVFLKTFETIQPFKLRPNLSGRNCFRYVFLCEVNFLPYSK